MLNVPGRVQTYIYIYDTWLRSHGVIQTTSSIDIEGGFDLLLHNMDAIGPVLGFKIKFKDKNKK